MIAELFAVSLLLSPAMPAAAPPPLRFAQSQSANACMINCDTAGFGCRSGCITQTVPIQSATSPATSGTAPNTTASPNAPTPAQCNLSCSTQQSLCRQSCTRLTQ